MTTPPDPTDRPCPKCEHTGGVTRIDWGLPVGLIYYRCAGCGHLWATDQAGTVVIQIDGGES